MRVELYLARHGESLRNREQDEIAGGGDAQLTERGRKQASELGRALADLGMVFDQLWCSPLIRARESMVELCRALGTDQQVHYDGRLKELWAGDFEGRPKREVITPEIAVQMAMLGMGYRYPNGDSMNDVADRFVEDWLAERMAALPSEGTARIFAMCHGQVIRSARARLFGVDPMKAWLLSEGDNASLTKLLWNGRVWREAYANRSADVRF